MKLIAIGYLGEMVVFTNISRENAIERYNKENPTCTVEDENLSVKEIEVNEKFYVYDIWSEE